MTRNGFGAGQRQSVTGNFSWRQELKNRTNPERVSRNGNAARIRRLKIASIFSAIVLIVAMLVAPSSWGADPCAPGSNKIVCENSKTGTDPEIWDIWGAGDETIQGFSTDISVNLGNRIDFKIDTNATNYTIDIYRTGWYQGLGARKIATVQPSAQLPQIQPECPYDQATEITDCGNWKVSASWNVPADAVSGVYVAKLTRTDTGGGSHITFIVRDDSSHSDVLFQTSDPTWHAYNMYGGADFYQGAANGRAYKLSYNRPFATREGVEARDFYFGAEYPLVRFLERNGYDVSYFSGVDTDRRGAQLKNHKVFMSVGHDEYWSGAQRSNIEAARDAGVNLQFLTGNEGYWRTRYEPSSTGSGGDHRTLVTYKETWANAKIDPTDEWTGTWRDPRFAGPENGGGKPENELTGTAYRVNFGDFPVTVNSQEGKMRLWRNTELASLPAGTSKELAPHTVGYESNEILENGFRPAGQFLLSTTVGWAPQILQDFGNTLTDGETTHHLSMYRAPSGALVFSSGSIQWTWGLDATHDGDGAPADPRMQQAQANLLADMGALPQTLMSGLVMPSKSTDTAPPTLSITQGPQSTTASGTKVDVKGTAADASGVVTAVEYSTDSGATWQLANGTSTWSFTYSQTGMGGSELLVRGIDDSGNYDARGTVVPVQVPGPYSVFGSSIPQNPDSNDGSSVELGMRFSPTVDGHVTGIRFYKSPSNTGTHVGTLWSSTGSRLARVQFTGETASGWQQAVFDTSVAVEAGSTYVVSYSAPNGHYSGDNWFFAYRGLERNPLAVAGGFGANPAGVYNTSSGFPESSYQQGNYYVDAMFQPMDAVPLQATAPSPADTAQSVALTTPIAATLSKPVLADSVKIELDVDGGSPVSGTTTYDPATRRAVFEPSSTLAEGTRYVATISAKDSAGHSVTSGSEWSFRTVLPTAAEGDCPCGIYADSKIPDIGYINDQATLTLGTRFTVDRPGALLGLKFYRDPANPGPHTGKLYRTDGTVLGTVDFGKSSVSGWQYAEFAEPVRIAPDTQYVASYTTTGPYSASLGEFTQTVKHGPISTHWESGQYSYSSGYPSATTSASYLVDVAFDPDPLPLDVETRSPAPGSVDVDTNSKPKATFNEKLADGYTAVMTMNGGQNVAGSTSLSADRKSLEFIPTQPLEPGSTFTLKFDGLKSQDGASMPAVAWSFSTLGPNSMPSSFLGAEVPQVVDPGDSSSISLGLRLTATQDIDINALRYYRTAKGTGEHTGTIWSSGGQKLATAVFANGNDVGWQTAVLDTPVAITAGTTFTVSYFAPQGGYAYSAQDFTVGQSAGALTLSGTNGVYRYGDGTTMPDSSFNSTNYFADLIYSISGTTGTAARGSDGHESLETPMPTDSNVPSTAPPTADPAEGSEPAPTDESPATPTPTTSPETGPDATSPSATIESAAGWSRAPKLNPRPAKRLPAPASTLLGQFGHSALAASNFIERTP